MKSIDLAEQILCRLMFSFSFDKAPIRDMLVKFPLQVDTYALLHLSTSHFVNLGEELYCEELLMS